MGRKEDRKLKKLHGEKLGKTRLSTDLSLHPMKVGREMVIPVHSDKIDADGPMSPEEFSKVTYNLSDKELNRIIYENAKFAVREGLMPDWPEDDFGIVLWFTWNFITDEMRQAFPAIAREYLDHFQKEENKEEAVAGWKYDNIPYPRMQERTWDDAYYFRVLLMMLYSARGGSAYSRNFLLSLYKVYYKQEYNKLKKLSVLTYLDVLEFHDEDCFRKGFPSGHTVDGKKSFKEMTIERRMHEPGWTNVYGGRSLSPVPGRKNKEAPNAEIMNEAVSRIKEISECPDEPPVQPTASRIFVMAELMGLKIDPTCNEQAIEMNSIADSMSKLNFLNSPEYRKFRGEMVERCEGILRADYPEMFDPFEYQSNQKYIALQVAESILSDICKKYDANFRMPYDSKKFNLPHLMADLTITLGKDFDGVQMTFDEVLILSMVQYLGECLCELMAVRDTELDEILKISRRKEKGEWQSEKKKEDKVLTERVLRSVESLREEEEEKKEKEEPPIPMDEDALRAEVERLRTALSEKEAALAESEQKTIQQRVLYEKARDEKDKLLDAVDEAATEHAELIALREFVYTNSNSAEQDIADLDDTSREEIIEKIREKKVTILGGTERWIKRMKRLLPSWSFISVDDNNSIGAVGALERADYIYIYTSALQHAQYYRAMNIVRSRGKMLYYLGSTNIDSCLKQFSVELNR